jgi:hypothetical protein
MLLILVHPTGQGDDEKGKRVQERAHRRRLSCRLPHPLRPMISFNLSFCTRAQFDSAHIFVIE